MKTFLLTGATGFIGSHLLRRLTSLGWTAEILVRPASRLEVLADLRSNVRVHTHDGSTPQLVDILQDVRPNLVIHLASHFQATHAPQDVEDLIRSNILFATQLAEAMNRVGCTRLLNAGTSWQHYQGEDYNPVCLYAATKQAYEDILEYFVQAVGLRVITLTLSDTYGPCDRRRKLFSLLRSASRHRRPIAMSPGEQRLDLVYISDVLDAFQAAAERLLNDEAVGHERYTVSSGEPVRLRDVAELYERVTEASLEIVWGGRAYREREVMYPWDGGTRLPGWSPKVSLEEGIRRIESDATAADHKLLTAVASPERRGTPQTFQ